ncbi:DUF4124 domain-containing protein [Pseudomarimonas arenosa]|nr:DUF4124 domain-containing protein [Pseudomarimonas arenosa]
MTLMAVGLAGCLALSAADAGEIYKWTDEQGRTHYSDQPPPESQKNVERRDLPSEPNSEPPKSEPESPECQLARKNLKVFEGNPVVLMDTNNDGTNERLEGEELQRYADRARQQIDSFCGNKPADEPAPAQEQG